MCCLAGNVTAKDVQAFVLTAFTNEVQRLRNADMDAYMNFERNTPKVRIQVPANRVAFSQYTEYFTSTATPAPSAYSTTDSTRCA